MGSSVQGGSDRLGKFRVRVGALRSRRQDPLWARLLVLFGALLMLASGGAFVGAKTLLHNLTSSINESSMLGDAAVEESGHNVISGVINVLLVGLDERPDGDEGARADSIIILHVPASHDQAYLVSLPRDLLVDIPADKKLHPVAERNKINASFYYGNAKAGREGGMELLAKTINKLTGIKFNGGAIVNFGGFQDLVTQLGGVDMCLDQAVDSHHIGTDSKGNHVPRYNHPNAKPVHYDVGCRHLEAWEALDYVRQRYNLPKTDYDRARHQQQFLKAVLKRAKEQGVTSNPLNALRLVNAGGKALTVDRQGIPFEDWAFTLQNVTDKDLVMLKTNAGQFHSKDVPGIGACEELTSDSITMFTALREARIAEFVIQHGDFVTGDVEG